LNYAQKEAGKAADVFVFESGKVPKSMSASLTKLERDRAKSLHPGESFLFLGGEKIQIGLAVEAKSSGGELQSSLLSVAIQQAASLYKKMSAENLTSENVHFEVSKEDVVKGVLVGLDLAHYTFVNRFPEVCLGWICDLGLFMKGKKLKLSLLNQAVALSKGMNLARHLVNLPPNHLLPGQYEAFVKQQFGSDSNLSISVWNEDRLKKEGMNLMLAVGGASESPPRLIHLKYRPKGSSAKKPIALVGKGITFDSGGLDIKPPQYMRLMKKDMGGSAAVLGLLRWALASEVKQPLDVYLAIAENAISDEAFRPSDVLVSRSGHKVEIDNTDAEGRLVLADALDVAATRTGKDAPQFIVDMATLTGAIKVGLGKSIAGLFSNDTKLRSRLQKASERSGDLAWSMPLYEPYRSQMATPFADFQNAGEPFGGAITAALFLQTFVGEVPWAHIDIYAWNDGPSGSCLEKGGSGQGVALLADFIENL